MVTKMSDSEVAELLRTSKKIAVVGLSPVPARPSYGVTEYMIDHGYEIYGVRPAAPKEILGRPAFEKISDLPGGIDIVDVFRNIESIPDVVDDLAAWMEKLPVDQRPKALWLQLGIHHPEAEAQAAKLGLKVISNKCILVEHRRLL